MASVKYILKNVETFHKSSNLAEVLKSVTFKVAERMPWDYYIVSAQTHRDTERVHYYFEKRIVDDISLNPDIVKFIMNYHKIIGIRRSIMNVSYEPVWEDQNAIIAHFDSREKCNEYVNGLWDYILNCFV